MGTEKLLTWDILLATSEWMLAFWYAYESVDIPKSITEEPDPKQKKIRKNIFIADHVSLIHSVVVVILGTFFVFRLTIKLVYAYVSTRIQQKEN